VDGITVGTITGTTMLDGLHVADFGNQVVEFVKDRADLHLLLDFKNLTYMTSQGLTELLRINEAVKRGHGALRVCGVSPEIHRVFEITNLEKMFSIHPHESADEAALRFKRALSIAADEDAWAARDAGA
jgi:stage II sporulation protein AA (anti-sigma F factor antagonist)